MVGSGPPFSGDHIWFGVQGPRSLVLRPQLSSTVVESRMSRRNQVPVNLTVPDFLDRDLLTGPGVVDVGSGSSKEGRSRRTPDLLFN